MRLIKSNILITVCVATLCGGTNCFAAWEAAAVAAIPLNSHMTRVRLADGSERVFARTPESPELLIGPEPWKAIERPEKRMLNVIKGDAADLRHEEYCFIGGRLRFISKGGKDSEVKDGADWSPRLQDISSLWPTAETRREDLRKNDIWRGAGRIRILSRNPNRTALVLAQIALIFLGIGLFARKRIWYLHAVLWFFIFGVLLLQAGSRGGLLGLFAGLLPIVFFRFRHLVTKRQMIFAFATFVLLAGGSYWFYASHRASAESSTAARVYIWKEVPRMIAAAPMGWGLWQSGPAYNSWFEKPERMHSIGDLFNDHLSRFVEGGFVFGGLYVFLWVFALVASWRHAWRGGSPVALALLATYGIVSSFNPMNYWAPSFYVMGGYLLVVAVWRLCCHCAAKRSSRHQDETSHLRCSPSPLTFTSFLSLSLAITLILLAGIAVVALCAGEQDVPLRVSPLGRRVVVGRGEPKVWVADDGFVLCGDYNGFPGRELRDFYKKHPNAEPIGFVESLAALPRKVDRLVITGKLCEEFLCDSGCVAAEQVVIYSPPFGSKKIKPALRKKFNIEMLTGEFAAMRTGDIQTRKKWVHIVPGAELYVPHWLDMMVNKRE